MRSQHVSQSVWHSHFRIARIFASIFSIYVSQSIYSNPYFFPYFSQSIYFFRYVSQSVWHSDFRIARIFAYIHFLLLFLDLFHQCLLIISHMYIHMTFSFPFCTHICFHPYFLSPLSLFIKLCNLYLYLSNSKRRYDMSPLQSIRRPRDMTYFCKLHMTNSFQTSIFMVYFSKMFFWKCIFHIKLFHYHSAWFVPAVPVSPICNFFRYSPPVFRFCKKCKIMTSKSHDTLIFCLPWLPSILGREMFVVRILKRNICSPY